MGIRDDDLDSRIHRLRLAHPSVAGAENVEGSGNPDVQARIRNLIYKCSRLGVHAKGPWF